MSYATPSAPGVSARPRLAREQRAVVWLVGAGSFTTAFTAGLTNVVNPAIVRALDLDVLQAGSVLTSYLLTLCALIPWAGRLGDLLGHRRVFGAGLFVFALGAAAAGAAPGFELLLAARVLMGVGAALLAATGPALITTRVPATSAGRSLGSQASLTYAGLLAGPAVGAWLASVCGWRGAMLGVAMLGLTLSLCLPTLRSDAPAPGATPPPVSGMRASVGALLRTPGYLHVVFAGCLHYAAAYAPSFLLPLQLELVRGEPPLIIGGLMAVPPLVMSVGAPWAGGLADRYGSLRLTLFGLSALALGLACVGALASSHLGALGAALVCVGLGAALFVTPNNRALMTAAPASLRGLAGAVLALSRQLGMLLGVLSATLSVRVLDPTPGAAGTLAEGGFAGALSVSSLLAIVGALHAWHGHRRLAPHL